LSLNDEDLAKRLKEYLAQSNLTRKGGKNYANSEEIPLGGGGSDREQIIKNRKQNAKKTPYRKIKYAYSVVEGKDRIVYVGGHVPKVIEVFRVPATTSVSLGRLNNLGGLNYSLGVIVTVAGVRKIQFWKNGSKQWEFEWKSFNDGGAAEYNYAGHGFWFGSRVEVLDTYTLTPPTIESYFSSSREYSLYNGKESSGGLTSGTGYSTTDGALGSDLSINFNSNTYILPGKLATTQSATAVSAFTTRSGQSFSYECLGINASGTVAIGLKRSWTGADSTTSDNSYSHYSSFWYSSKEEISEDDYLSYGPPDAYFFMGWFRDFGQPSPILGVVDPVWEDNDDVKIAYELNPGLEIFWYYKDYYTSPPGSFYPQLKFADVFNSYFTLSYSEKYGSAWSTKSFDDKLGEVTVETYNKNFTKTRSVKESFYPPKTRVGIGRFSYHP